MVKSLRISRISTKKKRLELLDTVAEEDEELMEKYLEGHELTVEEINSCIRKGTIRQSIVPRPVRHRVP